MSSKTYKTILVVTNGLQSSAATHETALSIAKAHQAKVILVDSVRPPGTFASWISPTAKDVFEMVLADKQKRLDEAAAIFQYADLETETKVLLGKSSEAIVVEAVKSEVDIVIRYAKGPKSKFTGKVGNTARELLRFCPVPVLLVDKQAIDSPRILACFDAQHDIKENEAIVSASSCMANDRDDLFGLYCWDLYGADLMKKRMRPDAFDESLDRTRELYANGYDRMINEFDADLLNKSNVEMVKGEPYLVIPKYCDFKKIDVLAMCTATLNHPVRRYFGSTVEAILENLPCALLAVKPEGFVSPITPESKMQATV